MISVPAPDENTIYSRVDNSGYQIYNISHELISHEFSSSSIFSTTCYFLYKEKYIYDYVKYVRK